MRQVVFRRQARREFDEAGDWYEKECTGLGMEFLAEIQLLIQRIASTPSLLCICGQEYSDGISESGNQQKMRTPFVLEIGFSQ